MTHYCSTVKFIKNKIAKVGPLSTRAVQKVSSRVLRKPEASPAGFFQDSPRTTSAPSQARQQCHCSRCHVPLPSSVTHHPRVQPRAGPLPTRSSFINATVTVVTAREGRVLEENSLLSLWTVKRPNNRKPRNQLAFPFFAACGLGAGTGRQLESAGVQTAPSSTSPGRCGRGLGTWHRQEPERHHFFSSFKEPQ